MSNGSTATTAHLDALFSRAAARVGVLRALRGATTGVLIATVWFMRGCVMDAPEANRWSWLAQGVAMLTIAALGGAIGWWQSRARRHTIALEIEHRWPDARNLLVTAQELQRAAQSNAASPDVSAMVLQRADRLATTVDVPRLMPLHRHAFAFAGSIGVWALAMLVVRGVNTGTVPSPRAIVASVTGRTEITRVSVRVTPPRYVQRAAVALRDPSRIEALAGSTISLAIEANADSLVIITRDGAGDSASANTDAAVRLNTRTIARGSDRTFSVSLPASADGFVALEPRRIGAAAGTRRLIGLTVRSDESPRVRIAQPARDMIFPDAKHTLDVRLEADDDIAIASLRLRYTKVSGAGERFTFSEGEVPVAITRPGAAQWTAKAQLALEPLLKEAGDLVVYRAIATDSRPGSPAVESDSYIAELVAPGGIAATGFSVDPDEDRYALSQQMVILKTERLIAKRTATPAANVSDDAAQLAVEQRRVRAEFVFMMGGEFAQESTGDEVTGELDETAEAEAEGDLAAGRMANRGRIALLSAVRHMSRAAVALTTTDLATALVNEKTALTQLQEAFARARFLMRALSQREQLDLTRRQTGKLDSISRTVLPVPDGERDARRLALRAILADVMTAAAAPPRDASGYTVLAERVLQVDPSSKAAQQIAAQLSAAATATSRTVLLDSAATALTAMMRSGLRPAAINAVPAELRALQAKLHGGRP